MSEETQTNASSEHREYVTQRCESSAKERESLVSSLLSVSERFDKWVIGLPAGAVGLTLIFYEKVVAQAHSVSLGTLAWSWVFLCAAIGLGFLSLYFSTLAVQRQIEIQDGEHDNFLNSSTPDKPEGGNRHRNTKNKWSATTHVANLVSVTASLIGVALFLYFAFRVADTPKNLPTQSNEQRQRQTDGEEGRTRATEERNPTATTTQGDQGRLRPTKEPAPPPPQKIDEQFAPPNGP